MPIQQLTRGDSFNGPATCRVAGSAVDIPLAATVEILVIGCAPDNTIVVGPRSVVSTDSGNDWPNGVVGLAITPAESAVIPLGRNTVRVRVTDGSDVRSYDESIDITP